MAEDVDHEEKSVLNMADDVDALQVIVDYMLTLDVPDKRKAEAIAGLDPEIGEPMLVVDIDESEVDLLSLRIDAILKLADLPEDEKAGILAAYRLDEEDGMQPGIEPAILRAAEIGNASVIEAYRSAIDPLKDHPDIRNILQSLDEYALGHSDAGETGILRGVKRGYPDGGDDSYDKRYRKGVSIS